MKITHLHNAVRRDINNQTGRFNIIINMEDKSLSSLYVKRMDYYNLYSDYIQMENDKVVGRRGVLIENITPMDTINGRLIMSDIDNMKHEYPNMVYGNMSSEHNWKYKPKTYLEKINEMLKVMQKKIEKSMRVDPKLVGGDNDRRK